MDDYIDFIGNATVFPTLDGKWGYFKVSIPLENHLNPRSLSARVPTSFTHHLGFNIVRVTLLPTLYILLNQ